jgi:hypothetical protein
MGKPHPTWSYTITIDPHLRDYQVRLTPKWAERISNEAARSPRLTAIVMQLLRGLRSVEILASVPFTITNQLRVFVDNFSIGISQTELQRIAGTIAARLVGNVDIADPGLRQSIQAECLAIGHDARKKPARPVFSTEDMWRQNLADPGFRLAIETTQHVGFASAYNAYEHFLVRCVGVALGRSSYRKRSDQRFARDLTQAFGIGVCDACINAESVQQFRAARHSITHAGGRETESLRKLGNPFQTSGAVIHISPLHVRNGFEIIEACANLLVPIAAQHSAFA